MSYDSFRMHYCLLFHSCWFWFPVTAITTYRIYFSSFSNFPDWQFQLIVANFLLCNAEHLLHSSSSCIFFTLFSCEELFVFWHAHPCILQHDPRKENKPAATFIVEANILFTIFVHTHRLHLNFIVSPLLSMPCNLLSKEKKTKICELILTSPLHLTCRDLFCSSTFSTFL